MTEDEQFALNELADDHPLLLEIQRLRTETSKLAELQRVAGWAELLLREVAPEIAAELRKAIRGDDAKETH